MPGKKRKVWVWLTLQQIDALLAAATVMDSDAEALERFLRARGDRAAFRGAIAELEKVRRAMETSE